jgi:pimeloyl-ACP methyl ester carboxylesterase
MPTEPASINRQRRQFLGQAATSVALAELAFSSGASAATGPLTVLCTRQVKANGLDIGYHEAGPVDGIPVLLLHGYPYDIHSYAEVAALLAARGCRVIVPHLRGHSSTRFLDKEALRNAQQSAVALDQIALLDALNIDRAVIAGFDWGARTACIIGALWPQRCLGVVSAGGYIVNNLATGKSPLPAKLEHAWWYQYYFATENGRAGLAANRRDIARILWTTNSPKWNYDEATFQRTAASFDNPDYVDIVIHNYRWRLTLATGEAKFDRYEQVLATRPVIAVPAITIEGDANGIVPPTDGRGHAAKFSALRGHRVVAAGHNVPQEAPQAFADAVWDLVSLHS